MIVIRAVLPLPDNLVYYDFCLERIMASMSSALDPPAAGAASATGAGVGSGVAATGSGAGVGATACGAGAGVDSWTGGATVVSLVPSVAGAIMPAGL